MLEVENSGDSVCPRDVSIITTKFLKQYACSALVSDTIGSCSVSKIIYGLFMQ